MQYYYYYIILFCIKHPTSTLSKREKNHCLFLSFLQDLFSEALDDKIEHLDAIESAHYIYPVDVKSVLTNQDLKTVVCRNF